ncbi:MAG: hypothetical protein QHC79_25930 [Pseudosphingobacterium sp.]|nr:hypothetical protein [Pseudosphingobacterium sp.]
MDADKKKELIDFLISIGFDEEHLHEKITSASDRGRLSFDAYLTRSYHPDKMSYTLNFKWDLQFGAYSLHSYQATFKPPHEIEHKVLAGINTRRLDGDMDELDWDWWFQSGEDEYDFPLRRQFEETLAELQRLQSAADTEGSRIAEQLMFKHWPAAVYNRAFKRLSSFLIHHTQTFTATPDGICHPNLAYHILSGNLQKLYELLLPIGLDNYTDVDIHRALERNLAANEFPFIIKGERNNPDGNISYSIPVDLVGGKPEADHIEATITPHPPLDHGVFNGVNTSELDMKMSMIDWHNDTLFEIIDEENDDCPHLLPEIDDLLGQVLKVENDPEGRDIADKLMLKYWTDADFLDSFILPGAWKQLEDRPSFSANFPLGFQAKAIFNLLCGRNVLLADQEKREKDGTIWIRLIVNKGYCPREYLSGPTKEELMRDLRMLPLVETDREETLNDLCQGERPVVTLQTVKGNQKAILELNQQGTLNIYSSSMRPIFFNFRLQEEWDPYKEFMENRRDNQRNDRGPDNRPGGRGR